MNKCFYVILLFTIYLSTLQVHAAPVETFQFESEEVEKSFHKLSEELRCLVCQNQSIAESNAGLAKDLRRDLYKMLSAGKSEDEIVDFMVQRYGDYVLYRPPLKPLTWILWFGPAVLFVVAVVVVLRLVHGQASENTTVLSEEERERIKQLKEQMRSTRRADNNTSETK